MDKENKNTNDSKKSKSTGFKVPEAYFDTFESNLFEKFSNLDTDKEGDEAEKFSVLRNEESLKAKRDPGFKVPDGYFEKTDIKFKNEDGRKMSPKVRSLRILSLSIAASILLFFGIKYMNKGETSIIADQVVLQNDEISDWVADDLVYFDTYEIAEAFDDVELEQNLYSEDAVNYYIDFVDIESLILEN